MKRKPLSVLGCAFLLATSGLSVAVAEGPLRVTKKAAEKGDLSTKAKPNVEVAEKKAAQQTAAAEASADEVAIRLTGDSYVKAFCAANAKSLAAHDGGGE